MGTEGLQVQNLIRALKQEGDTQLGAGESSLLIS